MIDLRLALSVFLGTLPIFGAIVWNLIVVKSIRSELLQIRAELSQIHAELTDIRKSIAALAERVATLEVRERERLDKIKRRKFAADYMQTIIDSSTRHRKKKTSDSQDDPQTPPVVRP